MEKQVERKLVLVPAVDICEDGDRVLLRVEMPGVGKDNIEVRVERDTLYIEGRRVPRSNPETFLIRERKVGDYRKQFTLDETIDRNKLDAVMKNGVLTITLHTSEAAKPKRIEIKAQ